LENSKYYPGLGLVPDELINRRSYGPIQLFYQYIHVGSIRAWVYTERDAKAIHIDQEAFEAKMPDRSHLINHEKSMGIISQRLSDIKESWLIDRLESMEWDEIAFLKSFMGHIREWQLSPTFRKLLSVWEYNVCKFFTVPEPLPPFEGLSRSIETTLETLPQDSGGICLDTDLGCEDDFSMLTWAYDNDITFFSPAGRYPENCETPSDIEITLIEPRELKGDSAETDIIFCKSVEARVTIGEKIIESKLKSSFYDGSSLIIPDTDTDPDTYTLAQQCTYCYDEGDMLVSSVLENKERVLTDLIALNRSGNIEEYLLRRINDGQIPSDLYGKKVTISIGQGGKLLSLSNHKESA